MRTRRPTFVTFCSRKGRVSHGGTRKKTTHETSSVSALSLFDIWPYAPFVTSKDAWLLVLLGVVDTPLVRLFESDYGAWQHPAVTTVACRWRACFGSHGRRVWPARATSHPRRGAAFLVVASDRLWRRREGQQKSIERSKMNDSFDHCCTWSTPKL